MSETSLADVTVTLGSVAYTLRVDVAALSQLEDEFDRSWGETMVQLNALRIRDFARVVRCLIVEEEKPAIQAIVKAIGEPANLLTLTDKVGEAFFKALPKGDGKQGEGSGETADPR